MRGRALLLGGTYGGSAVLKVSPSAGWATAPAVRSPRDHSATCTAQSSRGGSENSRVPSSGSTIQTRSARESAALSLRFQRLLGEHGVIGPVLGQQPHQQVVGGRSPASLSSRPVSPSSRTSSSRRPAVSASQAARTWSSAFSGGTPGSKSVTPPLSHAPSHGAAGGRWVGSGRGRPASAGSRAGQPARIVRSPPFAAPYRSLPSTRSPAVRSPARAESRASRAGPAAAIAQRARCEPAPGVRQPGEPRPPRSRRDQPAPDPVAHVGAVHDLQPPRAAADLDGGHHPRQLVVVLRPRGDRAVPGLAHGAERVAPVAPEKTPSGLTTRPRVT